MVISFQEVQSPLGSEYIIGVFKIKDPLSIFEIGILFAKIKE